MNARQVLPGDLLAPQRRDAWASAGALDLVQRASQRVDEILATPQKPCLTPAQSAALRKIERKWLDRVR